MIAGPQSTTWVSKFGGGLCQGSSLEIRPGSETWTAALRNTIPASARTYLAMWIVRIIFYQRLISRIQKGANTKSPSELPRDQALQLCWTLLFGRSRHS
jgi:hypothetical protein